MPTEVQLISDGAVTGADISNSTITADDIANNAVTTGKIDFGTALVPLGGIIMWSGASVPTGWQLCNNSELPSNSPLRSGFTNTPDLRDRFIVGTGTNYAIGAKGGSADATLVAHNHGLTGRNTGSSTIRNIFVSITRNTAFPNGFASGENFSDPAASPPSSIGRATLDSAGSSATNANLPPYYALAFIMRVL